MGQAGAAGHFVPEHRVSGIGVARDDISERTARGPHGPHDSIADFRHHARAAGGGRGQAHLCSPSLQALFRSASQRSGMPAELIEAVAYLESWGDAKAESPDGPKGIMQISEATARSMGLKVVHGTRYKITREKVPVNSKSKKPKYRIVTHKTPYQVTLRDDRLVPGRAIPAAAKYLAGMERKFGGRDWAIFAYHCGQGCVAEMQELTRRARGIPQDQVTVARMFFSCSPAWNRGAVPGHRAADAARLLAHLLVPRRAGGAVAGSRTGAIRPHLSRWRNSTRASSRRPMGVPTARRTGFRSGSSRTTWCFIAATIFTATWGTGW